MVTLPASYYQQFDADYKREVPAEGFGGWKTTNIELDPARTAVVVMHAWECGTMEQWPGWRRCVEYHPRALEILAKIFPPLLNTVRASQFRLYHVVGGGNYYQHLDGYRETAKLAGPSPRYEPVTKDATYEKLQKFRSTHTFVGEHNWPDVTEGFKKLDFAPEARPKAGESIAEDGHQLAAICRRDGVNHLIYVGFAINWCLLMSPGGMVELGRYGVMCSTIREAVTAVENRETARDEREKMQALWRVALEWGFVFGLEDFLRAAKSAPRT
jgi:hypothetical protein